jgi:hypothetical protein
VSQYDGTLIDAATGKIITRKRLFANENDFYCEPKFMLSPDGKTFRFGLRTSKLTRGVKFSFMGIGVNKMMDKAQQSNSVEVFTLNEKLEITKTVKLSIPEAYLFITCTINNRQEIVAASYDDNRNIFIEKYDAESGKLVTKQTVRVESRNNREFEPRLYTSKQNPDIAYLTIDYINQEKDKTLGIYRVDFASNKVSRNETIIDKPFRKDGEKQYVQVNEKAGKPDADDWRNLETRKVIEYNDKLIVCTEVVYMYRRDVIEPGTTHVSQGRPTWITGDVIVNILDKDLKPLSMQVVPKHNQLFTTVGACSSFYIRGNSLLLVGATDKGSGLHAVYAQVNIASGKLEKIEIMEKKDISKKDPPDPLATVWFEDGFVINYLDPDGFFVIKKISTSMQQVSYQ